MTQSDFDMIKTMCVQHGIEWEDHRSKNGALWIVITDPRKRLGFATLLGRFGFKYADGKGYWLKDTE